jgi:Bacterial Ig-like domain (group 3)/FG-GAP-like repeat
MVLFAIMSWGLMGTSGCGGCQAILYFPGFSQAAHDLLVEFLLDDEGLEPQIHGQVQPRLTGSDGSQTGVASFLGNLTAITEPDQTYFLMLREPNCSLAQFTATSGLAGSAAYGSTTTNYEQTLHQLAGLTTKADVFANGCKEKTLGITSRAGVFAGVTKQGIAVLATAQGNGNSNAVFVLTANSSLSPINFTPIASLTAATALAAGDFNGDGNGDLLVVNDYNATSSYVSVVLGNPDGSFQTPVNYPIAGNMSVAAVVDDVNGDGKEDIVAASDDQHLSVLLGNGDGTFQPAQSFSVAVTGTTLTSLITADLRGDGKKDLICSNGLVLLGNGDGTFAAVAAPAFPPTQNLTQGIPLGMASGDLNNDGHVDLVIGTGSGISTWLGKGDGTFTQGAGYVSINNSGYVTVTDLDGDGNLDIYSGLANGGMFSGDDTNFATAYALMGRGDGTFAGAPVSLGSYNGTNLGDVNGDGRPDLITSSTGPGLTVQLGTATGVFKPVSTITAPASFTLNGTTITGANTLSAGAFAVDDINGDGKADVVFADNGLNTTTGNQTPPPVYFTSLSNGDGTFATPAAYAFPQIAPAGDYDNDLTVSGVNIAAFTTSKHNDLVFTFADQIGGTAVANPYVAGLALLPGNGDGTFKAPVITTTFSSATAPTTLIPPQVVSTADFNGDGEADLLLSIPSFTIATGATSALELFLSNGDGTFKAPITVSTAANTDVNGSDPVPCTVADFNKDGKLDLACLGETSASQAQIGISLGNGDGTFAAPVILNAGGGDAIRSAGIGAADFNGDGKVDLALLDAEDFSGIFYGNGDGTFTSVPSNGNSYPKDLINLFAGGPTIATDLNGDGKPDILAGNVALINSYGTTTVPPPASATTTALTASAATITAGAGVTFTATVTGASGSTGTPTGTVTFLDGAATLGTGTLNASGVATYSSNALAVGAHSITAQYGGDSNFAASTSAAVTVTVQAAVPPSFKLGASPASLSITAGQSGTTTVSVTPSGGFAQPVTFACSGLPSEAACTFAPAKVTPGASAVTTTLTITTTAAQASVVRSGVTGLLALGSVLLLVMPGTRRVVRCSRWFGLVIALTLIGCGGSGSSGSGSTTSNPGTPSGTSTVTITATSGSITQTASLQVTVQ